MLNDQAANTSHGVQDDGTIGEEDQIRDIHALTPPQPPPASRGRRRENWETGSHRSSNLSVGSEVASSENFTSISREFNALVLAGAQIGSNDQTPNINHEDHLHHLQNHGNGGANNLGRIGEEEFPPEEETNPLAIVPDSNPVNVALSPRTEPRTGAERQSEFSVQRVKKEEVEAKISAWQNAEVAKINNRFKREDAIINGWESEQAQKANSWMKKVERKLEEKRAKALEKMQNEVAKAHRKAEERRASAEAKRGTKVARILEFANLMRAVGRAPSKRSFF